MCQCPTELKQICGYTIDNYSKLLFKYARLNQETFLYQSLLLSLSDYTSYIVLGIEWDMKERKE